MRRSGYSPFCGVGGNMMGNGEGKGGRDGGEVVVMGHGTVFEDTKLTLI